MAEGPQTAAAEHSPEHGLGFSADNVFSDPLLGCLEYLARHFDRAVPGAALVAGLPLREGQLTPDLFARAAVRAGLSARIVRRPLKKLGSVLLPAVLLLKDNRAVVLLSRSEEGEGKFEVLLPETGTGTTTMARSELEDQYSGYAILLKPQYQSSARQAKQEGRPTKSWFWDAIRPLWPLYLQVIGAAALVNILALAAPLFIMNVYDRVLPNKAISTLWVLAIGMGAAITFDFVLKTMRAALLGNAGRRADIMLASRIFEHVLGLDLGHRPLKTGEFTNQLRDFENVREFFTSNTLVTLTDFLFVGLFIFIIYQIAGILAIVPAAALVLVIIFGIAMQIPLQRAVSRAQAEATHRHSLLMESLTGLETIKCARAESQFQRNWEQFVGQNARTQEKMRALSSVSMNVTSLIQQLVTVGVIVIGVYMFDAGEVSPGAIIASVILASRAVGPLGQISATFARAQQAFLSLKVLDGIMATPEEHAAEERHIDRSIESGRVAFDNLCFTYPGSEVPALSNLNLKIDAGERVGIIGKIGSGKTTIGRLVGRLYLPTSGFLQLDGVDIRQYHPSEIRRQVALVSQDAALFDGSVRHNIALGAPHVSDDLVVRAARLAGVDDFVASHPKGYNMPVGESGRFLSSGQRQAIALARALLLDPMIVYLDEPSGAMDMASERELLKRLRTAFRGDQTIIVATHRSAMLNLVDRLVVLDKGQVVMDGPKEQVLEQLKSPATGQKGKAGRIRKLEGGKAGKAGTSILRTQQGTSSG